MAISTYADAAAGLPCCSVVAELQGGASAHTAARFLELWLGNSRKTGHRAAWAAASTAPSGLSLPTCYSAGSLLVLTACYNEHHALRVKLLEVFWPYRKGSAPKDQACLVKAQL